MRPGILQDFGPSQRITRKAKTTARELALGTRVLAKYHAQSTWLSLRVREGTKHTFTGTARTRDTLVRVHRHQWAAVNTWTVEVPPSRARVSLLPPEPRRTRLRPGHQGVHQPRAALRTVGEHTHGART